MDKKVRTRIAPSPTGSPHIGTAYAALFNYCFAKQNKGDFVLRIEDTDRTRYVPGSEAEIVKSLDWLGLILDEGPEQGGDYGPYRQSERLEIYRQAAKELVQNNKAYFCDCSPERLEKMRQEQQSRGEVPHYDRKCRYEPPKNTEKVVIRLSVPFEGETIVKDKIRGDITFQNQLIDDQVLIKSDGYPTYHLASVVDDHLMEISHVIRAEEWLSSTPKHVLLYQAFGWDLPEFAHLPLLRNADKSKISKRKNPVSLDFYRQEGYLPEALVNFLGLMGWSMPADQEIFTLEEMVKNFTFDRVDPSGPVFDVRKLDWLNGEYIRKLSLGEAAKRIVEGGFSSHPGAKIKQVLPLVKDRMKKLREFDSLVNYFFEKPNVEPKLITSVSGHDAAGTISILTDFQRVNEKIDKAKWRKEELEKSFSGRAAELNLSKTNYFQTFRATVSGSIATPPLFEILEVIGRDQVEERISDAIKKLKKLSV